MALCGAIKSHFCVGSFSIGNHETFPKVNFSATFQILAPEDVRGAAGLGMTSVNEHLNVGQAFGIEFLITFVLIWVKLSEII